MMSRREIASNSHFSIIDYLRNSNFIKIKMGQKCPGTISSKLISDLYQTRLNRRNIDDTGNIEMGQHCPS